MSNNPQDKVRISRLGASNRDDWDRLYTHYAEFYELPMPHDVLERVWGWLLDHDHPLDGLGAFAQETLVGIAHYRRFPMPVFGCYGLFLDDLYVDPAARRCGAARAILGWLGSEAKRDGLHLVRWKTAPSNTVAQAAYDRVAGRTDWLTYDMMIDRPATA